MEPAILTIEGSIYIVYSLISSLILSVFFLIKWF
jgi:hypothetical protein